MLDRFNRPEYLLQPAALLRRVRRRRQPGVDPTSTMRVELPWADGMWVFQDGIGQTIEATGVFDLPVTETIHRLLDPGDTAIDIGANVGYVTGLMAARVGPSGRVLACEPYPQIFEVLQRNVDGWRGRPGLAPIEAHRLAVSREAGSGRLSGIPAEQQDNMGLAALRGSGDDQRAEDIDVELARLDDLAGDADVGLLKIDVEGHELEVLEGAQRLLGDGRVRHVVFEDHGTHPTPPMTLLEQHGMKVYAIKLSPIGLRVLPAQEAAPAPGWPGPNYLATREPEEALRRLRPRGWRSVRLRPGRRPSRAA